MWKISNEDDIIKHAAVIDKVCAILSEVESDFIGVARSNLYRSIKSLVANAVQRGDRDAPDFDPIWYRGNNLQKASMEQLLKQLGAILNARAECLGSMDVVENCLDAVVSEMAGRMNYFCDSD